MYIAIINYNMGNIRSVENAFKSIGAKVKVTSGIDTINKSMAFVLPGVGAFKDAMQNLENQGLIGAIKENVKKKPFLGICLGFQLLFETSLENGKHKGLGLLRGTVKKIPSIVKVPHMGWNQIDILKKNSNIFDGIKDKEYFYFVHSYHAVPEEKKVVNSITDYGIEMVSGIEFKNIFGLQFHPEKSSKFGLRLLKNFWNMAKEKK